MAAPGNVDYHVHYFIDQCVLDEMTLPDIEAESIKLGLEEICVVKHYSARLPNGRDVWVNWKRIIPGQFNDFIKDIRSFRHSGRLTMLAGVETELLDIQGNINIPEDKAEKVDAVLLSSHWLPDLACVHVSPDINPEKLHEDSSEKACLWEQEIRDAGPEKILEEYVMAYVNAIKNNPRVRVLAHMYDGLLVLRKYGVVKENIDEKRIIELMEPLMKACVDSNVLWELTAAPMGCEQVVKRASELGVRFTATADAHSFSSLSWGNLRSHNKAEAYIDSLGLTKGTL